VKKALYFGSGTFLFVWIWRGMLWLFAAPLAYLGHRSRRRKREHREILEALDRR
jgi:hypothetical protein